MYKHTEYPTIRDLKLEDDFSPTYLQEKIDGANVRVIVPRDGEGVFLGTRKVILSKEERDFKNFKREFEETLKSLALAKLRPRVTELGLPYDEIVVHGELVGPSIFNRLKYQIDGLEVFFYDLSLFHNGERVTLPWKFREIQNVLKESGFRTIPYRPFSKELFARIDEERSFLNGDEHIEGFILRDESGQKIYKHKSSYFKSVEFGKKRSRSVKPDKFMFEHLRNKFGDISTLPPEEMLSLFLEEMISNYNSLNRKQPSKEWIKSKREKCLKNFLSSDFVNFDDQPIRDVSKLIHF